MYREFNTHRSPHPFAEYLWQLGLSGMSDNESNLNYPTLTAYVFHTPRFTHVVDQDDQGFIYHSKSPRTRSI